MNTGLVLSGGGAKGIAHIGAIKALEEHNIYPTYIAGTSSGAIVGALYASGCNWEEILDFFKKVQIFNFNSYARNKPGFIDTEKFYDVFRDYFPSDNFNTLKKKLFITTTNILSGTLEIFNSGELIKPLLASAAYPGVFTPVKIKDNYYIDGGTLNNFPVDLIKMYCDQVIGVYVNPFKKVKIEDLKYSYAVFERAFRIKISSDSFTKFNDCNLLIYPEELNNFGTFSLNNVDVIFNLGYESTIKALKTEEGVKVLEIVHN